MSTEKTTSEMSVFQTYNVTYVLYILYCFEKLYYRLFIGYVLWFSCKTIYLLVFSSRLKVSYWISIMARLVRLLFLLYLYFIISLLSGLLHTCFYYFFLKAFRWYKVDHTLNYIIIINLAINFISNITIELKNRKLLLQGS